MTPRIAAYIALIVGIGCGFCVVPTHAAETGKVDFNFQIRPLLSDRCYRCHGPDSGSRKAKLRLDTRDGAFKELDDGMAVVKPGDLEHSEVIRRIFTEKEDDLMPPPDSRLALTAAEKELLKRWVLEGADYKPLWSFIPVKQTTPPTPRNKKWGHNPIDAFVLDHLEKEKISPAPEAARETLIRRLALNLTGLPPTPAEIDGFRADKSPEAYEKVVTHYLNSPAYGERIALDWLDLARYADTYGYQADVDRDMSPYRDWVIQAFNENLPYDQFLTWQLAGDLLPNPTREQRIATAFNRLHRQTNEGGSIDEEFRTEYAIDRVNTFGTAMLGLTMECARCHDHKFDPIKQREYFSLLAFFNNIDESGLYSHFTRATPSPALLLWPQGQEEKHAALKAKIAALETALPQPEPTNTTPSLPTPIARFTFDTVASNTTPDSITATNFAKLVDEPQLIPGHEGNALQFTGDNQITCKTVPNFKRTDMFSFSLWLKPTQLQDRAVVLHQSRAWTRVKALSRRFASQWSDEYDSMKPVAHLRDLLMEKFGPFVAEPRGWKPSNVSTEVKDVAVARVLVELRKRVEDYISRRLREEHLSDWRVAYDRRGTGSARHRASDIRSINEDVAPVPDEFPAPLASKLLDDFREIFREAATAAGAEIIAG